MPADVLWGHKIVTGFWQVSLEMRVISHVNEVGTGPRVPKKRLREKDHQLGTVRKILEYSSRQTHRLPEVAFDLASQDMELDQSVRNTHTGFR